MHVYHAELDQLILDCIGPLVRTLEADGLIRGSFFVRHWQGGLHLRLRLLPAGRGGVSLEDRARDDIRAYLAAHPSGPAMAPADYQGMARRLMTIEPGHASIEPLREADTVRSVPYPAEPSLPAALMRNYAASSDLALRALSDPDPSRQGRYRTALAFTALTTVRAMSLTGRPLADHADDAYRQWGAALLGGDREGYERAFHERYLRQRDVLRRLLHTVIESGQAPEAGELGPDARRWHAAADGLVADLRGSLPAPQIAFFLHHAVHMHNNRIGLGLPDEAYLRYLIRAAAGTG